MGFIDSYKRLEKLCGEVVDDEKRLSAYIDEMINTPDGSDKVRGWNEDLKKLKHYRWIRNKIAHEPDCSEDNMCEPNDEQWLDVFYSRIINQKDPLSLYQKATRTNLRRSKSNTSVNTHNQLDKKNKKRISKRKRKLYKTLIIIALCILAIVIAFIVYVCDYYKADEDAISAFLPAGYTTKEDSDGNIVFEPKEAVKGFIFYPGGKVAHSSYVPLMNSLSDNGVLCVIVEMPFNLAVFDIDAADDIKKQYPQIKEWYIGGHSLGGSMAASYISEHADEFKGLVLLGSYSTANLKKSRLNVLSVYGSEDKVLDIDKYNDNKSNLPKDFTEVVIDGGCHAYFGMYGTQDGDGTPKISNAEQIRLTADAIVNHFGFISEGNKT